MLVSVDTAGTGVVMPTNFIGLSFEVTQLLPDANGVHYFRPDNKPLIDLFQTLGIKSLRIGGNTSDRDVRKSEDGRDLLPTENDLDSFFQFAKAAKVKVIYCLRLHNADLQDDIRTAKYIMDHYADEMDCFSIGQEPSAYPKIAITNSAATNSIAADSALTNSMTTNPAVEGMGEEFEKYSYTNYAPQWKEFADALIAAVPDIKFCGPSVHNNGKWATNFINDFGKSNNVVLITEHLYPGGPGNKITNALAITAAVNRMLAGDNSHLSNAFPKVYEKLYNSFVPLAVSNGLPYRLEEVNNYFNGGALHVSDTLAASLWGLDFMYWWAAHGAAGVNFHTGDKVAAGNELRPSKYTAYFTSTNGYYVRPLGYGIKAFELGAHGTNLPVTVSNTNLNLSVYAVAGGGGTVHVTIINKEHGTNAPDAEVTINLPNSKCKYAEAVFLTAPTNENETADSGITLGGATIGNDGSWNGTWTIVQMEKMGVFHLKVPAHSAVVVACMTANYDESKIGTFTLPDPLTYPNGDPVINSNDWMDVRRGEILKQYEGYIYGTSPKWHNVIDRTLETDATAFGGKATRKQISLEFYNYNGSQLGDSNNLVLHVLLYTPNAATNRVPTFLCLSFSPNYEDVRDPKVAVYPVWDRHTGKKEMPKKIVRGTSHNWPVEKIIDHGYGIALVDYNEIEPDLDGGNGWKYGVRSLYVRPGETNMDANAWGAISAWAFGASCVLDYLQGDRLVDPHRIIMVGQSRLGKTALWAGAEDQRFAMVIASCSGEMGASLSRRDYGETVTSMSKSYAYQFCPNFLFYSNNIPDMPVDSHDLISLIAPRPLFLNTGTEDRWSDPRGEWEAAIAAAPVYRLFNEQSVITNFPADTEPNKSGSLLESATLESYPMPPVDIPVFGDVTFHEHTGKHDIYPSDWDKFLDFADQHFYGTPPHKYTGEKPQTELPPPSVPMPLTNADNTASVTQTKP